MHVQSTSSSPEALRQARHIVGHPEDYAHLPPHQFHTLRLLAWAALKSRRGQPIVQIRRFPGDAA